MLHKQVNVVDTLTARHRHARIIKVSSNARIIYFGFILQIKIKSKVLEGERKNSIKYITVCKFRSTISFVV